MVPFSPPHIDEAIIDEVVATLKSGWITTGPRTKELERRLAGYTGASRVLCVNSATAGMELVLRWFGIGPGDEVIVPAYTYCATANVVLHCGATPIMVDVDEDWGINVDEIRKAISPRTKAVMPVDLFGMPSRYDEILEVLTQNSTHFQASNDRQKTLGRPLLLVDSAHSIGAKYNGKVVGSEADAMVFSFHAVKNLTTAEGGGIAIGKLSECFDVDQIYIELNRKGLHGQTKDALAKSQVGGWKYDIVEAGYKYNMPDVLAAIGLATFEQYESYVLPRRKEVFQAYTDILSSYSWALCPPLVIDGRESSAHVYALRLQSASVDQRDQIIEILSANGVSSNVHYLTLPMLTLYKNLGYRAEDYPRSFEYSNMELSLPVYPQITEDQINIVCQTLIMAAKEVGLS